MRAQGHFPPDAADRSLATQRWFYDQMVADFRTPRPPGLSVVDRMFGPVPVRVYLSVPPRATIVYLHGGGFIRGSLDSDDDLCVDICRQTGFRVVSVGYRLAPEHVHPAAYEDSLLVAREAGDLYSGPLTIVGVGAGATMAACVTQALRGGSVPVARQVLVHGVFGAARSSGSYLDHANAPMLTREDCQFHEDVRFGGAAPIKDATAFALHASDLTGVPKTILFSAECDPTSDEGRQYRNALVAAGCDAEWHCEAGLVHGYLRARHCSDRAASGFARVVAAIGRLGRPQG